MRKVATGLGASLTIVDFDRAPYDLAGAFQQGRKANVLALAHRLPSFAPPFMVADAGALVSYGVDFDRLVDRGIAVADRILKGAAPGDIPIEQVDDYRLVINMRTAKMLGIKVRAAGQAPAGACYNTRIL
ncbi:MAG: ABC transporter substrate binding protein [Betaproteobacteria bacterium]